MRSLFPALILAGVLGAATSAGPSGWQSFHSKECAFHAQFPGKPADFSKPVIPHPDAPLMHIYHSEDHGVPYVAAGVHFPHDVMVNLDSVSVLDLVVDYVESKTRIKVLSRSPYQIDGIPGREYKFRNSAGSVWTVRMALLGDYFYEWVVLNNPHGKPNPNASRFLASFQPDAAVLKEAHAFRQEQQSISRLLAASQGNGTGGWKELRIKRGAFSVQMPAFLRYGKSFVPDPLAPKNKATIYSVIAPSGPERREVYITGYAETDSLRPNENVDQWLDEFRNANSSQRGMRLTSSQDVTVNGYPGREYRYENQAGYSEMTRVVLANSRLYILTAIAPQEHSYSDDTLRFLHSFKLSGDARIPNTIQRPSAVRRDTL